MADKDQSPPPVPADDGEELVSKACARQTLEAVRERSPVRLFGKELLRSTASILDGANRTKQEVTAFRLALKLRLFSRYWPDALSATIKSDASLDGEMVENECVEFGREPPDGHKKKMAMRTH